MPLSQFAEPIESIGGSLKAYRMDSTKKGSNMRSDAGLGMCECCDYVTVSKDNQCVVLIEETDLESTIIDFKERYDYLSDDDQVDLLYDTVLRENRLQTLWVDVGSVSPVMLAGRGKRVFTRE